MFIAVGVYVSQLLKYNSGQVQDHAVLAHSDLVHVFYEHNELLCQVCLNKITVWQQIDRRMGECIQPRYTLGPNLGDNLIQ